MVTYLSFYGSGDKLHAPLATLLQDKFVERKSCKSQKVAK